MALVATGMRASQALAAVLLYRLASFWLVASAGWLVLLRLRHDKPGPGALGPANDAMPHPARRLIW